MTPCWQHQYDAAPPLFSSESLESYSVRASPTKSCQNPLTPNHAFAPTAHSRKALDSAFGAGSSVHVLAAIATTAETIAFTYVASQMSREYSEAHADAFLSTCTAMLVYTWLVGILEMVVPLGGEPKRVMPPPPPRLILKRPMNPGITNKIATNSSRVYVQSECSIADSIDSVEEDRSAWKVGRKNLGSVVPTEAL